MTIGLVGKKCGMTRVFTEEGVGIPVTVIEVQPNRITQLKTMETDGYCAVQVTMGTKKRTHVNKALTGHYAKANVEPGCGLWEFRLEDAKGLEGLAVGAEIKVDAFAAGQFVDVIGVTRGKGFAGTIKRHHFAGQDRSHGNSVSHRKPGSIGQRQSPGKVFKGKKMSGQLGNKQRTVLSQEVVRVDSERHLLLVSGAVPGAPSAEVIVRLAVKKMHKNQSKKGE